MVSGACRRDRAVAIETFSADVAPGAARRRGGSRRPVAVGEVRAVRRGCAAGLDRRRTGIEGESGDSTRRGGARVALIAELPRVTGAAAGGDATARHRPVAVRTAKPRIGVRWWRTEAGHVVARQTRCLRERDVALRARGVRSGEVGRPNRVALQAPLRRGGAHRHPRRSGFDMARSANRGLRARRGRVTHVSEPQVAAPRRLRRAPRHDPLDRPVVAGGA